MLSFVGLGVLEEESSHVVDPLRGLPDRVPVEGVDLESLGAGELYIIALVKLWVGVSCLADDV